MKSNNMARVVTPEMEAYFIGIALVHGTNPLPRYGLERTQLAREITECMLEHKGEPDLMIKLRRNYRELGGRLLDSDPTWFYSQLADAYLDWLYGQNAVAGAEHPEEAARKNSTRDPRLEDHPLRDWTPWWKT